MILAVAFGFFVLAVLWAFTGLGIKAFRAFFVLLCLGLSGYYKYAALNSPFNLEIYANRVVVRQQVRLATCYLLQDAACCLPLAACCLLIATCYLLLATCLTVNQSTCCLAHANSQLAADGSTARSSCR